MFLSTYENKIDKKGRVSVPASFRSYLSNLGYNGVICYPSFNNQSIEAWPQDRIEKISSSIDSLNPFEEKRDFFATSILSESINLQFDSEGRIQITPKLLKHANIRNEKIKQSFVYGDKKTYLVALIVTDNEENRSEINLYIENLNKNLSTIEKVKKIKLINEEFTIENGMLTPTLKLKRKKILEKYKEDLEKLY